MDLKDQIIQAYLTQGCGYRMLQAKYGISRTTICKWVQIYQGIHAIPRTKKQQSHYIGDMKDPDKKRVPKKDVTSEDLLKRISALEKQLEWEKHRADSLDIMINVVEKSLEASSPRKKRQIQLQACRKFVGFNLSDDMKVSSGLLALKKALAQKPIDSVVIHHSDREIQYYSTAYTDMLLKSNCMISMTENGDPYENAIAERVNGILKIELISDYYSDADTASRHIARCITIYNYRRRHSSLNWQIPHEVHNQKCPQTKQWKNYYYKRKTKEELNQSN